MALQYWRGTGRFAKCRLMTWRGGYHGDTFTPMSVCDPDGGMHTLWRDVLAAQVFAPAVPSRYEPGYLVAFEAQLAAHADELAAVIVEPVVQGAGGMRFHDPRYLIELRADLRPPRRAADLRRDRHRIRPHRGDVRRRPRRGQPRHHVRRQGADRRIPDPGGDAVHARIAETISGGEAGALMHGPDLHGQRAGVRGVGGLGRTVAGAGLAGPGRRDRRRPGRRPGTRPRPEDRRRRPGVRGDRGHRDPGTGRPARSPPGSPWTTGCGCGRSAISSTRCRRSSAPPTRSSGSPRPWWPSRGP